VPYVLVRRPGEKQIKQYGVIRLRLGIAYPRMRPVAGIKVSPPQGTVAVRLSREDDSALLRVTDQGPGIPAEELEVIFQPFRQGHLGTAKEGKSAGLGLAIANSIARGHGGRLWAESMPPNGASFFVLLPVSGTST
jgi:signal transduction histidine kinase